MAADLRKLLKSAIKVNRAIEKQDTETLVAVALSVTSEEMVVLKEINDELDAEERAA